MPGLAAWIPAVEKAVRPLDRRDLPVGVVHGDLFPDNVFFRDGKPSDILDFYMACDDVFACDLAVCVVAWGFGSDGGFDPAKGGAMFRGYAALRPLEPAEVEAMPVLASGAALRFLLSRLCVLHDEEQEAVKDPREFAARYDALRRVGRTSDLGRRG
jgi:homoserine kinase type II